MEATSSPVRCAKTQPPGIPEGSKAAEASDHPGRSLTANTTARARSTDSPGKSRLCGTYDLTSEPTKSRARSVGSKVKLSPRDMKNLHDVALDVLGKEKGRALEAAQRIIQ